MSDNITLEGQEMFLRDDDYEEEREYLSKRQEKGFFFESLFSSNDDSENYNQIIDPEGSEEQEGIILNDSTETYFGQLLQESFVTSELVSNTINECIFNEIGDLPKNQSRADPHLEENLIRVLKDEEVCFPKDQQEISTKVLSIVSQASKRPDSKYRAVMTAIKTMIVDEKRKEKKFKSTNSNYYKSSEILYTSIHSDILGEKVLTEEQNAELLKIWNFKSGLTDEWIKIASIGRENFKLIIHFIGLLEHKDQPVQKHYSKEKIEHCISDLVKDDNGYLTYDEILNKLEPQSIGQKRIKFPLSALQFDGACKATLKKLKELIKPKS